MTHHDSNCVSAADWKIDIQLRPSEEETDNSIFYFSTTHSCGRKGSVPPACCLNPGLVYGVWVTGLPRAIVIVHLRGLMPQ